MVRHIWATQNWNTCCFYQTFRYSQIWSFASSELNDGWFARNELLGRIFTNEFHYWFTLVLHNKKEWVALSFNWTISFFLVKRTHQVCIRPKQPFVRLLDKDQNLLSVLTILLEFFLWKLISRPLKQKPDDFEISKEVLEFGLLPHFRCNFWIAKKTHRREDTFLLVELRITSPDSCELAINWFVDYFI